MRLPSHLENGVKYGLPLETLTTFRIGGPAEAFAAPKSEAQLRRLVLYCVSADIPFRIIGAGSNILAADKGVRGVVIRLEAPVFRRIRIDGTTAYAGAGAPLQSVLRKCLAAGLSGAEFLAGIPGTVGGALCMNCGVGGIRGSSVGDLVEQVRIMEYNGGVSALAGADAGFVYRGSGLSGSIILGASFRLRASSPGKVREALRKWVLARRGQEYGLPSAGCVFKNPPGADPAGKLIDGCGLKGRRSGGALISEKHANFIVNAGGARCADVRNLMRLVRANVRSRYGIDLQPEIKLWK